MYRRWRWKPRGWDREQKTVNHPSTAGERSGLVLPLDRYLLWLCRRVGRPGPQCSPAPRRPPICPPRPAGTEPPIGPPPKLPRSLRPPRRPPGSRGSDSDVSLSVVNGRSSNNKCHSYRDVGTVWGRRWVQIWRESESLGKERKASDTMVVQKKKTGGNKKLKLIKTYKMTAINPLSASFHILHFPKSQRWTCTSANCVAVSSIPLAPPSRRLRDTVHKGTKDNFYWQHPLNPENLSRSKLHRKQTNSRFL